MTQKINTEPLLVRLLLCFIAIGFLFVIVIIPVIVVFSESLEKGFGFYKESILNEDTLFAVKLTLIIALFVVPLNLIFGIAASWVIAKHDFKGKQFLITLIDLPFSVSPVIVGLMYILVFGIHGIFGGILQEMGISIIFHLSGMVLTSLFVTFPFIARELIPLMQQQGRDEEEAATLLGSSGIKTFFKVTLPNIKWALIYGVLLCNARAMGEFGAVSVVSGHIKGQTNSLPLHVEMLYNEYNFTSAFAASSLLAFLAILTLVLKNVLGLKVFNKNNNLK